MKDQHKPLEVRIAATKERFQRVTEQVKQASAAVEQAIEARARAAENLKKSQETLAEAKRSRKETGQVLNALLLAWTKLHFGIGEEAAE